MSDLSSGVGSKYPLEYNPDLLFALNRADARRKSGTETQDTKIFGIDSWTCYELSWLNEKRIPRNSILYFSYSCNSKFFVESKSLKLYLFSLNNESFNSKETVTKTIQGDLEAALKTEISIELLDRPKEIITLKNSIDLIEIDEPSKQPNSLVLDSTGDQVDEDISCSLFRSLCPVTAQPDWATVFIAYKGIKIDHKSLLSYLLSFRYHQGFHEECVEKIFHDLKKRCELDRLMVRANYLRRGGIEINPIRSSHNNYDEILRENRQ
tara:strand:+ start:4093 stop:4890 length:798 start_codon:yes stop_codon:yes gene_type:complete